MAFDITFTRRPSDGHCAGRGGGMIAAGVRVMDYKRPSYLMDRDIDQVRISPLNSKFGTGDCYIAIPYGDVPELILALQRITAGPLEKLLIEHEAQAQLERLLNED